jgi:hypothetical protein
VLTEGKLYDMWVRVEHIHRKSLKRLAQDTGVSKSSPLTATQLLKPSSESWCLVCCKCKKDCCTCVFNETLNCERYLHIEGQRFQRLFLSVNKGKNFPSFQMCHGSIRMGSAASGAPVREAQSRERVSFIKKHPVE